MQTMIVSILSLEQPWNIVWICVLAFLLLNLLLTYPMLRWTASIVLYNTMKRKNSQTWSREWFHPDEESCRMRDEGAEWAERYASYKQDLQIENEGFRLYGEYYDFGYDRAVILIPGRTDSLTYSYFYASPYSSNGYNVLCIDQRAHGRSDGIYNTIGLDEHRDVLRWAELLYKEKGVGAILLHGICIGSACALYALLAEGAPSYFEGLVADGMYGEFYESYYLHMKDLKKPTFILGMVDDEMRRRTGYSFRNGPMDRIHAYHGPLLMLHGTGDRYSLPEKAQILYDRCPSQEKSLVWFEGGRHSKLRIAHKEQYDRAIEEFLLRIRQRDVVTK